MTIRWGSLIATPDGEIEWERVVHLLSAGACVVAIALLVALALTHWVTNPDAVDTAVWAGMLPITGGQIAAGISGRLASRKIQTGQVPGRRASDTAEQPTGGA